MNLIDADARVTVNSYDVEHEDFEQSEMSISEALDFATDEGCPPTIDAIPVEWIKARWGNSILPFSDSQWRERLLIDEWQREAESRQAGIESDYKSR